MTPREHGRYAAAAGQDRGAPRDAEWLDAAAWLQGYDRAEEHRKAGRDPAGHPPSIPQLCARDVRAVCNCCGGCRRDCLLPLYPEPTRTRQLLGRALRWVASKIEGR